MICLFSNPEDYTTTEVIRWLHHLGKRDVIRINYHDDFLSFPLQINISNDRFSFEWEGQTLYLDAIEAVWYRKGANWMCDQFYEVNITDHQRLTHYLNYKLKNEEAKLAEYLHHLIEHTVPVLGSSKKSDLNKLLVLLAAKDVGLMVPSFHISNNKHQLEKIVDQPNEYITKSLSDGLYLFDKVEKNAGYFTYTEKAGKEQVASLPEQFSPSLLQEKINKKFELRIFFLEDTCYAMAIFSQRDKQTQVDYRKYNDDKPNRYVPYLLPKEIDDKIQLLFQKVGLNTGSVDMMVDQEGQYYFLEINPVGQFSMVSAPCNYFLEKKTALYLINHARNNTSN
jgi:ATP-GRASP peptide maturase of grasp-with-spasm system